MMIRNRDDLLSAGGEVEIPRAAMRFRDESGRAELLLAERADGEEAAKVKAGDRFRMTVYTGGVMTHWLFGRTVIDLEGLQATRKSYPSLLSHDSSARVGVFEKLETKPAVVGEGRFLRRSVAAAEVRGDAEDGFPWEASIGADLIELQHVGREESVEVNGTKYGPGDLDTVIRQSRFREGSWVATGADPNTETEVIAAESAVLKVTVRAPDRKDDMADDDQTVDDVAAPELTLEGLKAGHPDLYAAARKEGFAAGVGAERERVLKFHKQRPHEEVFERLIAEGTELVSGLEAIIANGRERKAKALEARRTDADEPLGTPAPADPAPSGGGDTKEAWEAAFEKSPELQAEFGEAKFYVAFQESERALAQGGKR